VELLVGAGLGIYGHRPDLELGSQIKPSYFWSAEQRMRFSENMGVVVGFFAHRAGLQTKAGLHLRL